EVSPVICQIQKNICLVMCHAAKRFQTFREPKQMSYNVLALYVAENNVKNHLKALPKSIIGRYLAEIGQDTRHMISIRMSERRSHLNSTEVAKPSSPMIIEVASSMVGYLTDEKHPYYNRIELD